MMHGQKNIKLYPIHSSILVSRQESICKSRNLRHFPTQTNRNSWHTTSGLHVTSLSYVLTLIITIGIRQRGPAWS